VPFLICTLPSNDQALAFEPNKYAVNSEVDELEHLQEYQKTLFQSKIFLQDWKKIISNDSKNPVRSPGYSISLSLFPFCILAVLMMLTHL